MAHGGKVSFKEVESLYPRANFEVEFVRPGRGSRNSPSGCHRFVPAVVLGALFPESRFAVFASIIQEHGLGILKPAMTCILFRQCELQQDEHVSLPPLALLVPILDGNDFFSSFCRWGSVGGWHARSWADRVDKSVPLVLPNMVYRASG